MCFSENCLANASFLVSSGYVFLDSNTLPLTVLKKNHGILLFRNLLETKGTVANSDARIFVQKTTE